MFEKEVIIDGRAHLMGRLASVVAKQLLNGQRVVVVRTESINISGSLFRNKLNRQADMHHRINSNPRRGFKHWKAPSRMFWKVIRGMLPHKTPKGTAALGRLKVFEGIPFPYDHKKRVVVPEALKVLRLKSYRKFCSLGDLAAVTGWTRQNLIARLEEQRKVKSEKFHVLKQKKVAARAKAMGDKKVATFNTELKKYGF
jgi:large subunit ribosomal protein L13Ae